MYYTDLNLVGGVVAALAQTTKLHIQVILYTTL